MKLSKLFCHRLPERSVLLGIKLPLCTRCFGFFLGILVGLLTLLFSIIFKTKIRAIIFFLLMNSPLILDGITQYLNLRKSNNWLRLFTGILSGISVPLVLRYVLYFV